MKSTHRVEVVPVVLEPHPNADALSIVRLFGGGYTVCVRTADWAGRDVGAYIPPDSVCPDTEPFAFLGEKKRIRAMRLRGVVSLGLLVPAPEGAAIGDDVAELLGVTHYEPSVQATTGGEDAPAPEGYRPSYDVDSLRRYAHVFEPGEPVFVTEKIHGANGRWCFVDGEMHAGSRTAWKASGASIWWEALRQNPLVEEFCREHPELTVYGEVYGQVQDLKYGTERGQYRIAVFDLLRGTEWLDAIAAHDIGRALPWVPVIAIIEPFDLDAILSLAEGPSLIPGADHVREGVVVKPMVERRHDEVGRVNLKVVGVGYLERKAA